VSLWARILRRILPGLVDEVAEEANDKAAVDLLKQVLDPGEEEVPMPLSHKHSEIQAKASREAGRYPLSPEILADALQDSIHEPSGKLLNATPIVTSPRAITTRHTIVPPPRPPRKR